MKNEDMMKELKRFAEKVEQNFRSYSESKTREYLINPYLNIFGHNTQLPKQVQIEEKVDSKGMKKADYIITVNDEQVVLVEAKSTSTPLKNDDFLNQINLYLATTPIWYAALTNGITWRWYRKQLQKEGGTIELVPFLEHDVLNPSDEEMKWLYAFQREGWDLNKMHSIAEAEIMNRAVCNWHDENLNNPPKWLLDRILKDLGYPVKGKEGDKARKNAEMALLHVIGQMNANKGLQDSSAVVSDPVVKPVVKGVQPISYHKSESGNEKPESGSEWRYRVGSGEWKYTSSMAEIGREISGLLYNAVGIVEVSRIWNTKLKELDNMGKRDHMIPGSSYAFSSNGQRGTWRKRIKKAMPHIKGLEIEELRGGERDESLSQEQQPWRSVQADG